MQAVVIAENTDYEYKKDTLVYNVDAFRDEEDRKVEDVIKKLPGIEVDERGKIKYQGKDVKTVMLDGR